MRALIIGADGQDGYYLKEHLLGLGYEVLGVTRKKSVINDGYGSNNIFRGYYNIYADLTDMSSLINAVMDSNPDEIYNLAGQSEIPLSWRQPILTAEVNAIGVMRILEAIRVVNPQIKLFQASSSEIFGNSFQERCTENTLFAPNNPYGISKLFAHRCVVGYREKYGLFACCGIMFNHESPKRSIDFVTRKISSAAAEWAVGRKNPLFLGNLNAVRDWGYAGDYVRAMRLLLQQETPEDVIIATGESHSVREFATAAFRHCGIELEWSGAGVDETAVDRTTGETVVKVDGSLIRYPLEDRIECDPQRLYSDIGFECKYSFEGLVGMMVDYDIDLLRGHLDNKTKEG